MLFNSVDFEIISCVEASQSLSRTKYPVLNSFRFLFNVILHVKGATPLEFVFALRK